MLKAALFYASRGWPVLPLEPRGKNPLTRLVRHGVAHATTDLSVVREWWHGEPRANIGIATSEFLAVDPDVRNGGHIELAALLAEHGAFPTTPTAETGSGGQHILFKRPNEALRGKLCTGVDLVHGPRRYIVAAPSVHPNGGAYSWTTRPTVPLVDAPAWLLAMGRPVVRQATGACVSGNSVLSSSQRVAVGRVYASRIEPAVSGADGSLHTMKAIARLVHKVGLNEAETLEALSEWNARCQPPWSENELRRKIGNVVNGASRERRTA